MTTQRTPEGKWVVFDRATGQRLERWPVDARAMLASGDFTATTPDDSETTLADVAPEDATSQPPETPQQHALGVPLVLSHAHDTPPAAPMSEPVRSAGRRRI